MVVEITETVVEVRGASKVQGFSERRIAGFSKGK